MTSILLVTSSPRGNASHSTRLATELVEKLHAARPECTVVRRDLVRDVLPHIDPDFASGIATPSDRRTAKQDGAVAISDAVVDEALAADTIVVAAGIINFSIPSSLKAWLDHLARSGRTFRYTENGPVGLVGNKKVYLVVASGGVYSEGPAALHLRLHGHDRRRGGSHRRRGHGRRGRAAGAVERPEPRQRTRGRCLTDELLPAGFAPAAVLIALELMIVQSRSQA